MARKDKAVTLEALEADFRDSTAVLLTEYRGLSVAALKKLRRSLGDEATYTVAKNTLLKIAADRAGVPGLAPMLEGPSALAFVKGDAVNAAKAIKNFAKENQKLVIKGGAYAGKVLTVDGVKALAAIPSREVLLAQVAGLLKSPIQRMAGVLAAVAEKRGGGAEAEVANDAAAETPAAA